MAIILTCSCGRTVQARDEDAGKQARCPMCGAFVTIPYPGEQQTPASPSVPAVPEPPAPTPLHSCSVCGGVFNSNDVYTSAGRIICRRCYSASLGEGERDRDREREGDRDRDRDRDRVRDRDRDRDRDREEGRSSSPRPSWATPTRRRYDEDDDDEDRVTTRNRREEVPNLLVQAILVTLFCCWPVGIAAIVKAAQANSEAAAGNYRAAHMAADSAKTFCWVSFILGAIVLLIYVAVLAAEGGL